MKEDDADAAAAVRRVLLTAGFVENPPSDLPANVLSFRHKVGDVSVGALRITVETWSFMDERRRALGRSQDNRSSSKE